MSGQTYKLWLVLEDSVEPGGPFDFTVKERSDENAGVDLYAAESFTGEGPGLLSLGVRARMTRLDTGEGVHYWLAPRSSIYKTGYMMANSMGVIDKSYRGVLKAPVIRVGGGASWHSVMQLRKGERYFQILAPDMGWIKEIEIVKELPATQRGDGGFGSTGR